MKKLHIRASQLAGMPVPVKDGQDDKVRNDVREVLKQVARDDELLAIGLTREVPIDSAHIDKLVNGLREALKKTVLARMATGAEAPKTSSVDEPVALQAKVVAAKGAIASKSSTPRKAKTTRKTASKVKS